MRAVDLTGAPGVTTAPQLRERLSAIGARPRLAKYPFTPLAITDAEPDEIEAIVRTQGKERGEFWLAFDRLIAPVTTRSDGTLKLLELESDPWAAFAVRDCD